MGGLAGSCRCHHSGKSRRLRGKRRSADEGLARKPKGKPKAEAKLMTGLFERFAQFAFPASKL
jgi:hypothetical protein